MKARLLLDTCVLLDCLFDFKSISEKGKKWLKYDHNSLAVSVASIWEVGIKHFTHPENVPISASELHNMLRDLNIEIVPIRAEYVRAIDAFLNEKIHKDPFDHILLATAAVGGYILMTKDEKVSQYRNANGVLI